jgi:hypothetical protein
MCEAEADIGVCGQMKNCIATRHRLSQSVRIQVIALDKFKIWFFSSVLQELGLAGGEVIPADDIRPLIQQMIGQSAADEASRTGNKIFSHEQSQIISDSVMIRYNFPKAILENPGALFQKAAGFMAAFRFR